MAQETLAIGTGTMVFLKVMTAIAIIGALNWGLIGVFNWNLVDALFGGGTAEETSMASRVVYAVIGVCGVMAVFLLGASRSASSDSHLGMPMR